MDVIIRQQRDRAARGGGSGVGSALGGVDTRKLRGKIEHAIKVGRPAGAAVGTRLGTCGRAGTLLHVGADSTAQQQL
jgi:hypothetical protein